MTNENVQRVTGLMRATCMCLPGATQVRRGHVDG